ncbi:MAG TPA: DUF4019 domain-containing protein [Thermodesulfovibrionales bacterium]|nr:DUF4019 domain-containing protein [Thermodesulfovibrionales bacterium]
MKTFSFVVVSFFLFVLFVPALSVNAGSSAEEAPQSAALKWIALVDDGRYAESWDEASQYFKAAVKKDRWLTSLETGRKPLGRVIRRKLKSEQHTTSLPGAPDGEYVVIQYETSFQNKKSAVETITPALEKDGTWRVSGYYIK